MKKRIPVIAGNWKMNKTRDEALSFIYSVNHKLPKRELVESIIAAPHIYLRDLVKREGDDLRIAAQSVHHLESGAYTGEISASWLPTLGVEYSLVGHSERRSYYNETDADVNLKTKALIKHDIIPIICVGEPLDVNEKGNTVDYVSNQVVKAYKDISKEEALNTIVAYEPIWAIGTGKTATHVEANQTIRSIRDQLNALYGHDVSMQIRILYGGSVTLENIDKLLSTSDIDGALIGGASLDSEVFIKLVEAAIK